MTLALEYRVLKMEPLVGDDRPDERTEPAPGTAGSAAGPDMQAARAYEGQTVTLGQLEGMGRLQWEGDRVARLDTATESYRIELEPLEPSAAQARARAEAARVEAARERIPSGTEHPWLRWLIIAIIVLVLIGLVQFAWMLSMR
jgi:hypothetical protein